MIEQEEYVINVDQLVADIDEKVRTIDEHIVLVKQILDQQEITSGQDRALFHAMNLMLKERKGLMELRERALLDDAS